MPSKIKTEYCKKHDKFYYKDYACSECWSDKFLNKAKEILNKKYAK